MRAVLTAVTLVVLLAGCGRLARPVPAQCNEICLLPCSVNGDAGVRWEADPNNAEAWDELGGEVVPALIGKLQTCEVRRGACVQCLQRLDKAGIIHLK